eukprot:4480143-Pyramimonas_sp.AAC.2
MLSSARPQLVPPRANRNIIMGIISTCESNRLVHHAHIPALPASDWSRRGERVPRRSGEAHLSARLAPNPGICSLL